MTDFDIHTTPVSQDISQPSLSPGQQFAMEQLRMNPEISFSDLRDLGRLHGLKLHPLTYYGTKEKLGLVPKRQRTRKQRERPVQADSYASPLSAGAPRRSYEEMTGESNGRRGRRLGPVMTFVLEYLQTHPEAPFRELEQAARAAGHSVAASVYSRGKARLGLGRRRGGPPSERAVASGSQTSWQQSGREIGSHSLEDVVASIRALEEERNELRAALEKIGQILRDVLGEN